MSDLYRGFDVKQIDPTGWWVERGDESYFVTTYDEALALIDKIKREERQAQK